jgi:hypothetical protein
MFSPRPPPGSLTAPAPKPRRPSSETRGAGKHALQMQPAKSSRKRLPSSRILYTLCYLFVNHNFCVPENRPGSIAAAVIPMPPTGLNPSGY